EVFLARRPGSPELLVLKRVLPHLAAQQEFLDRFLHEARVVARLNDPTIVRIVELGDVDGQWFLAMEWVDGKALSEVMSRPGLSSYGHLAPGLSEPVEDRPHAALTLAASCRIALEAATALHVAHTARDSAGRATPIVHRDVSPHNLLISARGDVKLIDFGVAALAGQGASGGKLAYAAPEQLLEDVTDARSDQYSLGVVFWECLAGRACFDAEDDVEVIRLVTEVGVPELPASVPAGLRAVVQQMTAMDPAERFTDLAAARKAIAGEVKALKLDVSAAALAGLAPARKTEAKAKIAAQASTASLTETERLALALVRDGVSIEEAEAAIEGAGLPGSPFGLDVLQALIEKGALSAVDDGETRRLRRVD
ncbi:MAG TPA: serine/threonine-protein kinase, partial [Archangium sp.]